MSSPSGLLKVNYLVMRLLRFWSVRGDLQEGYGCASDANIFSSHCQSPSSRAQNRGFCALFGFGTPVFGRFEHKIEVFVRFWPSKPLFSGVSSTKSRFLCAFGLRNPRFRAFRAQNRGFCAFLASETHIFGRFEHKIEVFVRFCPSEPLFSGVSSTKSGFLCSMTWSFEYWESFLPFHG